jgi:hypothetical protein
MTNYIFNSIHMSKQKTIKNNNKEIWCQCGHNIFFHLSRPIISSDMFVEVNNSWTYCESAGCRCSGFRSYKKK